jgi:hypothetical protein
VSETTYGTYVHRVRRDTANEIAAKIREFADELHHRPGDPPSVRMHRLAQIAALRWAEYAARSAGEGGDRD